MPELKMQMTRLKLVRPTQVFHAWLTLMSVDSLCEEEEITFLSAADRAFLSVMNNPERIKEFLAGRRALRLTLEKALPESSQQLVVNRGVFGYPLLAGPLTEIPEVSLAHSRGLVAVLVFPAGQQMAVDLEVIRVDRPSRLRAIKSILTDEEKKSIDDDPETNLILLYELWSQKEALSKVLKCGLTVPFTLLETIDRKENKTWSEVHFRNFFQYRALSLVLNRQYVLSVVMPRKTEWANIDELLITEEVLPVCLQGM